jgi:hypothetical protein
MILVLRQRHRRVFAALSVLLPIAFAVGIAARRPVPRVENLLPELAAPSAQFTTMVWNRNDLFAKAPVQVRLLRGDSGRFAVAFAAKADFVKPDLIVYWVAGNAGPTDKLPDNATLLGSFSGGALLVPAEAASASGALILFSLADQEIVDVSKPIQF